MGLFFGQIGSGAAPVPPPVTSNIKYGRLYNWYAASDALFAPAGWHVPTLAELETLLTYIDVDYSPYYSNGEGVSLIAGGKLKENNINYWNDISQNTNDYDFNARGSAWRSATEFTALNSIYNSWTSSQDGIYGLALVAETSSSAYVWTYLKVYGLSIVLLKNDSTLVPLLTDLDGNVYRTTKIGDQVWLADNWACTKLNNGTPIPNVTDNTAWAALTTGACCAYDNDNANIFL